MVDRVANEELSYSDNGLWYCDDKLFTGVMEFRWPDGRLEAEREYKDGMRSGRSRVWYPSGELRLDAEFAWDAYHGRVRSWHENGQMKADELFEYGILIRAMRWDEQGRIAEQFALSDCDPLHRLLAAWRIRYAANEQTNPGNDP